jgi:hypothetical protein
MSATFATVQALLAAPGVTGIVKKAVNPGVGGNALPDCVVTRVSGGPTYALEKATGLTASRVQVECRARSYTDAEKLGQAVIAALQDCAGVFAGQRAQFRAAGSDYEDHADDASVYRRIIDFYCWTHPSA